MPITFGEQYDFLRKNDCLDFEMRVIPVPFDSTIGKALQAGRAPNSRYIEDRSYMILLGSEQSQELYLVKDRAVVKYESEPRETAEAPRPQPSV